MPYHIYPLRYAIDDWHQLPNAKSNTDPTLKIRITDFVNSDVLQCIRIQVVHPQFGILFACMVNPSGRVIDPEGQGLSTKQILSALKELGFDVRFKSNIKLNDATRKFLEGVSAAGYTHIRWALKKKIARPSNRLLIGADVENILPQKKERIVICFNENQRPSLLSSELPIFETFGGDVMEVSPNKSPNLDFSWLDVPMHIDSVLTDNL